MLYCVIYVERSLVDSVWVRANCILFAVRYFGIAKQKREGVLRIVVVRLDQGHTLRSVKHYISSTGSYESNAY